MLYKQQQSSENPRNLIKTNDTDKSIGNWAVILHDDTDYPGEVFKIKDDEVQVSVLEKHRNHCKMAKTRGQAILQHRKYCKDN